MRKIFILSFFLLNLTLHVPATAQENQKTTSEDQPGNGFREEYYSQVFGFEVCSPKNYKLYDIVSDLLGTPYRYAGKTLDGIDCSGLVNMLYLKAYGLLLSGNSLAMYNAAKCFSKQKLQEGDLVFFKFSKNRVSHVGLYLGDNKFVHSSRSSGVIISDLTEPYYKKYFAACGRMD